MCDVGKYQQQVYTYDSGVFRTAGMVLSEIVDGVLEFNHCVHIFVEILANTVRDKICIRNEVTLLKEPHETYWSVFIMSSVFLATL